MALENVMAVIDGKVVATGVNQATNVLLTNGESVENYFKDLSANTGRNIGKPYAGLCLTSYGSEVDRVTFTTQYPTGVTICALIEPGKSYIITKKAGVGDRFRLGLFSDWVSIVGDEINPPEGESAYKYTFTNTGNYKYLAVTLNFSEEVTIDDLEGMIRIAEDPSDEYTPYVMSNAEIMEALNISSAVPYADLNSGIVYKRNFTFSDLSWSDAGVKAAIERVITWYEANQDILKKELSWRTVICHLKLSGNGSGTMLLTDNGQPYFEGILYTYYIDSFYSFRRSTGVVRLFKYTGTEV